MVPFLGDVLVLLYETTMRANELQAEVQSISHA